MEEIQSLDVQARSSLKNGNWEIIITDPSLNKFSFAEAMSNKYIMTDVISPLGQKLTLYNTVPSEDNKEMVIGLNMEEIDQARISSVTFKSTDSFFKNWSVELVDNRNQKTVPVSKEEKIEISPVIELNKLMQMGFTENSTDQNKPLFELRLKKLLN
jgi:hypothetical protein